MDPATILTTALTVSKVVYSCSSSLKLFIENVSAIDLTLRSLYSEVETLRRTLESIMRILQSSSLEQYDKQLLWDDVDACLGECAKTLTAFEQKLETIRPKHVDSTNAAKSSVEAFKLKFRDDEIRVLRAQIHSHSFAMQMVLQMITVHISSTTPNIVLDQLSPQLQTLITLVTDLHKSSLPPEIGTPGLRRSRTRLERSAKEVASKASAVVSSRSTAWSGSQPDLRCATSNRTVAPRRPLHDLTTGSELGEPLTVEARERISVWMSRDFRDDNTILSIPEESPSVFSEPIVGSNESRTTPEPAVLNVSALEGGFESSDEDEHELEIEVAQRYLIEGRKRLRSNPVQAEEFLRKALNQLETLRSHHDTEDIPQISLELAAVCFEQDKLGEATNLCGRLITDTPTDDKSRERVLTASHILSQIQLRSGQFDSALRQCKRTLNGRRRLHGKDADYFQSVALMAAIYECRGDKIEALAYGGLLPNEFVKPDFKPPDPDLAGSTSEREVLSPDLSRTSTTETPVDSNRDKPLPHKDYEASVDSESRGSTRAKTQIDLATLPTAVAARLAQAKALSESFAAFNNSAMTGTSSVETVPLTSETEIPKRMLNDNSRKSFVPLLPTDRIAAIKLLEANGLKHSANLDLGTHFLWAAKGGHESVMRLLLTDWWYYKQSKFLGLNGRLTQPIHCRKLHPDTPLTHEGMSALHLAAMKGHSKIARILIDHGASRSRRVGGNDSNGRSGKVGLGVTPFERAVLSGDRSTVEEFLFDGVHDQGVDQNGWSLLHHAASVGKIDICMALIDAGLNIGSKSNNGTSAIHIAALNGNYELVSTLLTKGACINEQDHDGSTPLALAVSRGQTVCVKQLISSGADVQARSSGNTTLLHIAVQHGQRSILEDIVCRGLEIDSRNHFGETPLHLAVRTGYQGITDTLLALEASANTQDNAGDSPVHVAVQCGDMRALDRFMSARANMNLRNQAGRTPLMLAALGNSEKVINRLLAESWNVDVGLVDNDGKTAFALAKENGNDRAASLIRQTGSTYKART